MFFPQGKKPSVSITQNRGKTMTQYILIFMNMFNIQNVMF